MSRFLSNSEVTANLPSQIFPHIPQGTLKDLFWHLEVFPQLSTKKDLLGFSLGFEAEH